MYKHKKQLITKMLSAEKNAVLFYCPLDGKHITTAQPLSLIISLQFLSSQYSVVMNQFPKYRFSYTAPIPHQFVMKVYENTLIYVSKKCVNTGYIEVYKGILRYEKAL